MCLYTNNTLSLYILLFTKHFLSHTLFYLIPTKMQWKKEVWSWFCGNLSSSQRWGMWDLNLGLPLFRVYDLPHCTGLREDLKGLGGSLAKVWQLSELTLYTKWELHLHLYAHLKNMNCQVIKAHGEFSCYLE